MSKKKVDKLYQKIVEKSWNDNVDDYMKFTFKSAQELEKDENKIFDLVDKMLKKILSNLKNNIEIDVYDNILFNLGSYNNQDAYDFTVGVIKAYYENEFKINNEEYAVLDMFNTVVEQYKTKETLSTPEIFHYMLACLYRLHYGLFIIEKEQK